jgi:hypothetical protein
MGFDRDPSIAARIMRGELTMAEYARMLWRADGHDPATARPALARDVPSPEPRGQVVLPLDGA